MPSVSAATVRGRWHIQRERLFGICASRRQVVQRLMGSSNSQQTVALSQLIANLLSNCQSLLPVLDRLGVFTKSK